MRLTVVMVFTDLKGSFFNSNKDLLFLCICTLAGYYLLPFKQTNDNVSHYTLPPPLTFPKSPPYPSHLLTPFLSTTAKINHL